MAESMLSYYHVGNIAKIVNIIAGATSGIILIDDYCNISATTFIEYLFFVMAALLGGAFTLIVPI